MCPYISTSFLGYEKVRVKIYFSLKVFGFYGKHSLELSAAAVDMHNLNDNEKAEVRDKDEWRIRRCIKNSSDVFRYSAGRYGWHDGGPLKYWQTDNIPHCNILRVKTFNLTAFNLKRSHIGIGGKIVYKMHFKDLQWNAFRHMNCVCFKNKKAIKQAQGCCFI